MKLKRISLTAAILLLVSITYNLHVLQIPLSVYDEGIVLTGADRVSKGHVPYADFWSMYPPGQFYTLAFLFKVFGTSVLVERVYDVFVRSLLSVVGFLLIRNLGLSNRLALVGWGMLLVWHGSLEYAAYPVYFAMLAFFVGVYFFLVHVERRENRWLLHSGFFVGLGAMFRHDLAGMVGLSFVIALVLRRVTDAHAGRRSELYFLSALLLTGLPVALYLSQVADLRTMVSQLIVTPA
ncbi:MAG: glycosyltransferase family 39 protein, partial [Candidatus Krumholzibacteriota bacterium]|nr:glycosyltransferase family 39 protein [Candidatus Krumholzibacteriota bacterium]